MDPDTNNGIESGTGSDSSIAGFNFIDPKQYGGEIAAGSDSGNDAPRKRGRPFGSRNGNGGGNPAGSDSGTNTPKRGRPAKETTPPASIDPEYLAAGIMMFHMMAASRFPEMAMDQQEANVLALSMTNYLKHTKVKVDPKTQALVAMVGTIGMVEGTRVMAIVSRKAQEAKAARVPKNSQIVPMTGNGTVDVMDQYSPYHMPQGGFNA